jgi:hypothetical protein
MITVEIGNPSAPLFGTIDFNYNDFKAGVDEMEVYRKGYSDETDGINASLVAYAFLSVMDQLLDPDEVDAIQDTVSATIAWYLANEKVANG